MSTHRERYAMTLHTRVRVNKKNLRRTAVFRASAYLIKQIILQETLMIKVDEYFEGY